MRASVIGIGKLGAPLSAVLASKGHEVIGVDLNSVFVDSINQGKAPVCEPGLQKLIDASQGRLSATNNYDEAILGTDISFIIVPTPSNSNGVFTNKYVIESIKSIGRALQKKDGYHVINITSTVMPGSCDGEIKMALESASGRTVGIDIGLCYNPEFIALGSVVHDMLYPDMILLGESDCRAGDMLEAIYKSTCENNPPVMRMNLINAELTKISINTYVTTKITYANMLADICERLPGADADVVTTAVGMDSRIGTKYLKAAIGYGGPCFPRDNIAFTKFAQAIGAKAELAEATDLLNSFQIDRLISTTFRLLDGRKHVSILGLAYKPNTPVVEKSQGVELAARLADMGVAVNVFDPMALENAMIELGNKVSIAVSAEECVKSADVVVITTGWEEFKKVPESAFIRLDGRVAVLDCWRLMPTDLQVTADLHYVGRSVT